MLVTIGIGAGRREKMQQQTTRPSKYSAPGVLWGAVGEAMRPVNHVESLSPLPFALLFLLLCWPSLVCLVLFLASRGHLHYVVEVRDQRFRR